MVRQAVLADGERPGDRLARPERGRLLVFAARIQPLPVDRARRDGARQRAQPLRRRLAVAGRLHEPASGEIVDEQPLERRAVARAIEQAQRVGRAVRAERFAAAQGAEEFCGRRHRRFLACRRCGGLPTSTRLQLSQHVAMQNCRSSHLSRRQWSVFAAALALSLAGASFVRADLIGDWIAGNYVSGATTWADSSGNGHTRHGRRPRRPERHRERVQRSRGDQFSRGRRRRRDGIFHRCQQRVHARRGHRPDAGGRHPAHGGGHERRRQFLQQGRPHRQRAERRHQRLGPGFRRLAGGPGHRQRRHDGRVPHAGIESDLHRNRHVGHQRQPAALHQRHAGSRRPPAAPRPRATPSAPAPSRSARTRPTAAATRTFSPARWANVRVYNDNTGERRGADRLAGGDLRGVPEPSAWAALLTGAGLLIVRRRRARAGGVTTRPGRRARKIGG